MMAKMFYRFEEARQVLNMSDEQLKQMTREGRLREFRDGTQVMYKADQVDALRSELGLGDSVDLGPSDTGGPIGLADTRANTASGSVISLADTTSKDDTATDLGLSSNTASGTAISPAQSTSGSVIGLSNTNTGSSIGLASSNTGSGVGLTGTKGGTGMGMSNTSSASGISVLGLDEGGNADANAATAMGGSFGGEPSLEAMGSGSGLLDLSRERDDTSLGAPVLDEIHAGSRSGSSVGPISGGPISAAATSAAARAGTMPVFVTESDSFSGFATGASAASLLLIIPAIYAIAAGAMGARPTILHSVLGDKGLPFLYVFGAGLVLAIIVGVIGFVVGKKR
jgi:hypothetical protein